MIKSLNRSLAILEYLSKQKSAGVTELAEIFELDKGTVSRIMQTFESHGMVAKSITNAKYHISSGTLQLSYNVIRNNRIIQIARPSLYEVSRMTKATARLCMIDGKQIFIIDQTHSTRNKDINDIDIPGTTKPMYCSAIGKTILAFMQPNQAIEWLKKIDMSPYTENTLTDINTIMAELAEIRKKGYALNLAEFSDRAYCVAVPIFCHGDDIPKYCIGITGWQDFREDAENFNKIINCLKMASNKIATDKRLQLAAQFDTSDIEVLRNVWEY
ncbi:MAG: IclR family transcriptional regulator [Bacillota bacterium]|nr:IclR family transcriptional regulator [Bacillota bacterium]